MKKVGTLNWKKVKIPNILPKVLTLFSRRSLLDD